MSALVPAEGPLTGGFKIFVQGNFFLFSPATHQHLFFYMKSKKTKKKTFLYFEVASNGAALLMPPHPCDEVLIKAKYLF